MQKIFPPTYLLGAMAIATALHVLFPIQQFIGFPWRLIGLLPLAAGIAFNLIADRALKTHRITVKPFEDSNALVTTGVFAISRNPMYVGMTLILLGLAVLLGSVTPFALVLVQPVLFNIIFITAEEAMVQARFGGQFREYRKRVRKWI